MTFLCCGGSSAPEHDGAHVPASDAPTPSQLIDTGLDPTTAMQRRYPRASRAQIIAFASELDCHIAGRPAFILMAAAFKAEWGIVHEMVKTNTVLIGGDPSDISIPFLPWVYTYLQKQPESFNGNVFLALCAYKGDLTIVRYVVERQNVLGISALGLIVAPAVRMCSSHCDDAFWLLDNLPLNDQDYTDACGLLLNAIFINQLHDQKQKLAAAMQRKGATGSKLMSLYASMPHVLSLRGHNDSLDPKAAMMQKYPMAGMETVRDFASSVFPENSNDLAHVLQIAVVCNEWNIVHKLLDMGINPQRACGVLIIRPLRIISDVLLQDPLSDSSNSMLAATAFAGNITVLRYMLSLQSQVQSTRIVFSWLPFAAGLNDEWSLTHWLLNNLDFNDNEFEIAVKNVIVVAAKSGNIHAAAAFLKLVQKRCNSVNLDNIAEAYLESNVSNLGIVQALLLESWLPENVLVFTAVKLLPAAAKQYSHKTYKWVFEYTTAVYEKSMTNEERKIQEYIANGTLADVKQAIALNFSVPNFDEYIYVALAKAAKLGRIDVLRYLLAIQPTASEAIKSEFEILLASAVISKEAEVLLLLNDYAPKADVEDYISYLDVFFMHVLATSHISAAMPLIQAELSGPFKDRVLTAVVLSTSIYGTPSELQMTIALAASKLNKNAFSDLIVQAIDMVHGTVEYLQLKLEALLQAVKGMPAVYPLALEGCIIHAATNDSPECTSFLMMIADWQSEDERQSVLTRTAEWACKLGKEAVLNMLLDKCIQVPAEVRMKWPFNDSTWHLALHGISTERLLAAQLASAECDDGANYDLVRHGVRASCLEEAQLAASLEADERKRAYLKRKKRSQYGIEEADMVRVCDAVKVGTEDYTALGSELCSICSESLVMNIPSDSESAPNSEAPKQKTDISDSADKSTENDTTLVTDSNDNIVPTPHSAGSVDSAHDIPDTEVSEVHNENAGVKDSAACPPTQESGKTAVPVVRLRCNGGHVFHRKCVYKWFGEHASCPTCDQDLRELLQSKGPAEPTID